MIFTSTKRHNLQKILGYLFNQLEVKVTDKVLKQALEEQWKYKGSIRGIKEILSDLEIKSKVFSLNYNDLLYIECPFLAHIEEDVPYFVVINKCSEETVSYFSSTNGNIIESIPEFIKKWSGVVLIPLTIQQSGDPEYKQNLQEEKRAKRLKLVHIFVIFMYFILLIYKTYLFHIGQQFAWIIILVCKFFGTIISVYIVRIEFGNSDSIIRRICTDSECEKVLHSEGSKIFSWLSMGDVGIIYFLGGLLLLSRVYSDINPLLNILLIINLLTLPYTLYSLFYQWKIAKAFCPFCCAIIFLLWIEFLMGLSIGYKFSFVQLSDILYISVNYLITIIIWFLFKSFILKAFSATSCKSVLSEIKKDVELFNSTLNARLPVPQIAIQNEMTLGSSDANNILIVIMSSNCQSCYQLYAELKDYSQQFPERLKIILRFKGIDTEKSETNEVIDWIHSLHFSGETSFAFDIYESWNKMKLDGIRKWEEQNHLNGRCILPTVVQTRLIYSNWINSLDITGVPTLIFDGKILPGYYTFNDIKYLIRRLNERSDF